MAYLDTSAFVPLLVSEASSGACRRFWDDADAVVSSRLLYVETAAAMAQARRMGRLTEQARVASLRHFRRMWSEFAIVEVDENVSSRAAALVNRFGLRGYDAVHCASAERVTNEDGVAASGDQQLLHAWVQLGLATFDTNASVEA